MSKQDDRVAKKKAHPATAHYSGEPVFEVPPPNDVSLGKCEIKKFGALLDKMK